ALPAEATGFLIYPVDFPLVGAAEVKAVCAVFAAGAARIVAPSFQHRRGHPVVVAAAIAPELLALPAGGSAREVMKAHAGETAYVACEDARVLIDMDTPEAYAECLARHRARVGG